jgi:hypothetical protein
MINERLPISGQTVSGLIHHQDIGIDLPAIISIQYKYNPLRARSVLAYLNMAMEDAGIACWEPSITTTTQGDPDDSGFKTDFRDTEFPKLYFRHSMFSAAVQP